MYIKSIQLEGFKSYSRQTIVGPFDPHFNAITGLNGTGKSNILDAICFVLGISSLSTVRASKLEDLITKTSKNKSQDHDGPKTAKVAIVFDNTNKAPGSCPIGYEYKDEIIVARSIEIRPGNKEGIISQYHLNGHLSQKNVVVDLFGSIRLDVNNPNFMIMQGKITKVVNMRPKELLQMIEETVGATIYQNKRDKAKAALDGFDRSRESLTVTMKDTVLPALELQKVAAREAAKYNELVARLDKIESQYAIKAYLHLVQSLNEFRHKQAELAALESREIKEKQDLEALTIRINEKKEQLKEKFKNQASVKSVEKEISALKRVHAADEAKYNSARLDKEDSAKAVRQAKKEYENELAQIEDFKVRQKGLIDEFDRCQTLIATAEKKVAEAEEKVEKINFGNILDDDGKTVNIQEEVSGVEQAIRELKGPNDIMKRELIRDEKIIRQKEEVLRNTATDEQVEWDYKRAEAKVQQLDRTLRQLNINPAEVTNLDATIYKANAEIGRKRSQQDSYYRGYDFLRFTYTNPSSDFHPSQVHGLVYELFEVNDIEKYKVALEVVASGSFRQVVVDRPETAKALVARGNLRNRTTFQPLSVLTSFGGRLTQQELDRKFGPNNAFLAINLVTFDQQYRVLMGNIFGSTVICTSMEIAKMVAYQLNYRAVTLDGDMVDPGGLMQGGTRKDAGKLLVACQGLRRLKYEIAELSNKVEQWNHQLETCNRNADLAHQYDEAKRDLQRCKELRDLTDYATLDNDLRVLKKQYAENKAKVTRTEGEITDLVQKEKSLKQKLKNQEQLLARSRQKVDADLNKWKRELQQAQKQKEAKDSLYREIEIDLKAKDASLKDCEKDINEAIKSDEECKLAFKQKEEEFQRQTDEFNQKMEVHQEAIRASKEFERKIENIDNEISKIDAKLHELDLSKMKRDVQVKKVNDKCGGFTHSIESLVNEYPAIEFREDMQATSSQSVHALKAEVNNLKSTKEDMRSRLDLKAAEALPTTEQGVHMTKSMLSTINKNKGLIEAVVDHLDSIKMTLVHNAYTRVNTEFGYMMNTLLPESNAKLVQVNPNNLADGVVIHVCLGGVWKESLTELSGGQRSLVALSLMLSLCMYNPAPFYVLDEIDSALDLNHTMNIGYLIKSKFTNVQFICVSLKDGMFNNANVIFRTGFENGSSHVQVSIKSKKNKNTAEAEGPSSKKSRH